MPMCSGKVDIRDISENIFLMILPVGFFPCVRSLMRGEVIRPVTVKGSV
jgi:hypothetical protein